jgi:hypothetical protein
MTRNGENFIFPGNCASVSRYRGERDALGNARSGIVCIFLRKRHRLRTGSDDTGSRSTERRATASLTRGISTRRTATGSVDTGAAEPGCIGGANGFAAAEGRHSNLAGTGLQPVDPQGLV